MLRADASAFSTPRNDEWAGKIFRKFCNDGVGANSRIFTHNDGNFCQKFTTFHKFFPNFRSVQTDKNSFQRRKLWFLTKFSS